MKTINYNGRNLYCSIELHLQDWQEIYDSADQCFDDLKFDIKEECEERGYNKEETEQILFSYWVEIGNYPGEWCNNYYN